VLRAFIVRPFGVKDDLTGKPIDFDRVERELLGPALTRLGVTGRTTGEIVEAGNIREDMFERLLTADLVVADVSVHNANVFYELGIRHALRERSTFLIRCRADAFPFDLQTDRYFTYDRDNPGAALEGLVEALRQTLDSEGQDSPVFRSLPGLRPQEQGRFRVVPFDFREEVGRAAAARRAGDLALLAAEAEGLDWEGEGLRRVAQAQTQLEDFAGAEQTWERVLTADPHDKEANLALGTVYERLGDPTRANQAVERALERKDLGAADRACAFALLGRNKKNAWKREWWDGATLEERRDQALRSPLLQESFEDYLRGFREDRNDVYSGLNALAMLSTLVALARARPDVFAESFEDRPEAVRATVEREKQQARLTTGVELAVETARGRQQQGGQSDVWLEVSQADLACLTARQPALVASAYRKALAHAEDHHRNTAAMQLHLYERLDLFSANVRAALQAFGAGKGPGGAAAAPARVLLFTGHRLDRPDRPKPRFPAAQEGAARAAIGAAVRREQAEAAGPCLGLAGAASGGDVLFHEACAEAGIPSELYLVMPRQPYVAHSVQPAGPGWVGRFDRLWERCPHHVLGAAAELPRWLRAKPGYGVWQRSNLWMLYNALAYGAARVTLIALWDGQGGDGPGGTEDLIRQAERQGVKSVVLDTRALFAAAAPPSGPARLAGPT
jgi:hypothetical protein